MPNPRHVAVLFALVAVGVIFFVAVTRRSTLIVLSRGSQEDIRGVSPIYPSSTPTTITTHPPTTVTTNNESSPNVVDMYNRLVTVTAVSDNHFVEAQGMLASVQQCLPHNKVIIYDLGLSTKNWNKFTTTYQNIELRNFPFSRYSHLPHVKNLMTYAWKPIIIKEVSLQYDVIMYGDASMRMISCNIEEPLKHLTRFPFFSSSPNVHMMAIEYTHDGMIDYLHYPKDRRDIANMKENAATMWMVWVNKTMKEKFIEPWLDCALHVECIAPKGSKRWPCGHIINHDGHYIGCHRYDQSALNLILAREFGPEVAMIVRNKTLSDSIWAIKRV